MNVQVILHTGDMRWNPRMGRHPALAKQRIDQLFLDTTYASPKHTFPSQVCRKRLSLEVCVWGPGNSGCLTAASATPSVP